jgi:hypothetical protein
MAILRQLTDLDNSEDTKHDQPAAFALVRRSIADTQRGSNIFQRFNLEWNNRTLRLFTQAA